MTRPDFTAPGPGTWEMDAEHFTRPAFGPLEDVFPDAFAEGMRRCMKSYGMLIETFDVRFVNGFPYVQAKIVGAPPPSDAKPPPAWAFKWIFKALCALHPEVRRRLSSQRDLFVRRPWLAAVERWRRELLEATVAKHAAVDAVDVSALDDAAFIEHMRRVRAHACEILAQDHAMNLDAMIPVGDFLARAATWTGAGHAELLQLLRGCSAVSAGDAPERRAVIDALRADPAARALLLSDRPAREIWDGLLADEGEVGATMRAMRVVFGNAILHGIDLATPTVDDEPGALLAGLRAGLGDDARRPAALDVAVEQRLRARVPEEHRAEFDVLQADAKATYRLRDERHVYGALPTLGLARRAYQEAARRLRARGVVDDDALVFVARGEELIELLRGGEHAALLDELRRRARLTASLTAADAPAHLGPPPAPPPPPEWLPNDGARRAMTALAACMSAGVGAGDRTASGAPAEAIAPGTMRGLAVSRGVHEGIARICRTSADLDRVRQGDVLVAAFTTPAINAVLPILGAIVTDKGGALSHAAIVCREYGLPGVVGTKTATQVIKDGAPLRVDGDAGVVTLL